MKGRIFALAAGLLVLWCTAASADNELLTELATHHVDITARFTGQRILIFGAMSQPGDVIIKVVSPTQNVALAHKTAIGPFWLESGRLTVKGTPGLMYLLASRPVGQILDGRQRERYGLRFEDALMHAEVVGTASDMSDWRAAFARIKQRDGYYLEEDSAVKLEGDRLFFGTLALPAKIPLGTYRLDIYLVNGGKVISQQSRSLDVKQVRLEHWVAETAHAHAWVFGIVFAGIAMALGLALGMVLRGSTDSDA